MAICNEDEPLQNCGCLCSLELEPNCGRPNTIDLSPGRQVAVTLSGMSRLLSCNASLCDSIVQPDCGSRMGSRCGDSRIDCSEYDATYILESTKTITSFEWELENIEIADRHYINMFLILPSTGAPHSTLRITYTRPISFLGGVEPHLIGRACQFADWDNFNGIGNALPPGASCTESVLYDGSRWNEERPEIGKTVTLHRIYTSMLSPESATTFNDAADNLKEGLLCFGSFPGPFTGNDLTCCTSDMSPGSNSNVCQAPQTVDITHL